MQNQNKYRIAHDHEGKIIYGLLEYTDRDFVLKFVNAMNKAFPARKYRLESIKTKRSAENGN